MPANSETLIHRLPFPKAAPGAFLKTVRGICLEVLLEWDEEANSDLSSGLRARLFQQLQHVKIFGSTGRSVVVNSYQAGGGNRAMNDMVCEDGTSSHGVHS